MFCEQPPNAVGLRPCAKSAGFVPRNKKARDSGCSPTFEIVNCLSGAIRLGTEPTAFGAKTIGPLKLTLILGELTIGGGGGGGGGVPSPKSAMSKLGLAGSLLAIDSKPERGPRAVGRKSRPS